MPPSDWNILDFEKPITELDNQIAEIKRLSQERGEDHTVDVEALETERDRLLSDIFKNLTAWDTVLLARHPKRPYTLDYVRTMFDDYTELFGDKLFAEDPAMVGGIATIDGRQVMFVGHQKGRDLKDRQFRNFGSAKPEGYRKALRLMKAAAKFHRPIICFVDTPAADVNVGAESRGISESIARNMMEMSTLESPIIVVVVGEGGSGGAIGIAVGDRILMLEHSIYSVIPPEGCAAIVFKDAGRAKEAAEALKITSKDALDFGMIDEIVPEPLGGAHRNMELAAKNLKIALIRLIDELTQVPMPELLEQRYNKFRNMGSFAEK